MDKEYIIKKLRFVSQQLQGNNIQSILTEIASRNKDVSNIQLDDQLIMAGILGAYLHKGYCDGRKLENPLPNGLLNEPRIKVLKDDLDEEFVKDVLSGKIKTSNVLWIENGEVYMDIANTPFTKLSPFWQYDNFMAGACATRSIITNWSGITHQNPQVRKYVIIAVANAIHESWIARGNVGEWNKDLETAYISLSEEEKNKDLVHYQMAKKMMTELVKTMQLTSNDDEEF